MKRFSIYLYIICSLVIISTASCAVVPSSLRFVLNRRSVKFQGAQETVAQAENLSEALSAILLTREFDVVKDERENVCD